MRTVSFFIAFLAVPALPPIGDDSASTIIKSCPLSSWAVVSAAAAIGLPETIPIML
jgi:hypothetical protein